MLFPGLLSKDLLLWGLYSVAGRTRHHEVKRQHVKFQQIEVVELISQRLALCSEPKIYATQAAAYTISFTQRAWHTALEKMHRCLHKVLWKSLLLLAQISMFASMMQTVILQMPAPEIFRGLANPSDLADQDADQINGCIHGLVVLEGTCHFASTWTNVAFGRGVSCQCMVRWRIALQENQSRVGEIVIKLHKA